VCSRAVSVRVFCSAEKTGRSGWLSGCLWLSESTSLLVYTTFTSWLYLLATRRQCGNETTLGLFGRLGWPHPAKTVVVSSYLRAVSVFALSMTAVAFNFLVIPLTLQLFFFGLP